MLIIDAMRRSSNAQEVCLLLTHYIETLQFYAVAERLPESVTALPVSGLDDIEARVVSLREVKLCDLARSQCDTHGDIVNEATEVFQEALFRLNAMNVPAGMLAAPVTDAGTHQRA
jgi:hypothetical protein